MGLCVTRIFLFKINTDRIGLDVSMFSRDRILGDDNLTVVDGIILKMRQRVLKALTNKQTRE